MALGVESVSVVDIKVKNSMALAWFVERTCEENLTQYSFCDNPPQKQSDKPVNFSENNCVIRELKSRFGADATKDPARIQKITADHIANRYL